ncbi:MAG: ImmA/IrrE family metallo-endopeptidase [Anaerolineales bacterium]
MTQTNQTRETLQLVNPAIEEILTAFDIDRPPVPVELMLQRPRDGMWPEIDLSEMSATFLSLYDRYAPRMSAVRLLARNIARSEWGRSRKLDAILNDTHRVNIFARALIIPESLLAQMELTTVDKTELSAQFEVPEEDAQARLEDLEYG